jgi:hypothetical protein
MVDYLAEVRKIEKFFDGFEVRYVPRLDNRDADHLAWIASSSAPTPSDVIIEKSSKHSVKPAEENTKGSKPDLMVIDEPEQEPAYDWMNLIKIFLYNQPPSEITPKLSASRISPRCIIWLTGYFIDEAPMA